MSNNLELTLNETNIQTSDENITNITSIDAEHTEYKFPGDHDFEYNKKVYNDSSHSDYTWGSSDYDYEYNKKMYNDSSHSDYTWSSSQFLELSSISSQGFPCNINGCPASEGTVVVSDQGSVTEPNSTLMSNRDIDS